MKHTYDSDPGHANSGQCHSGLLTFPGRKPDDLTEHENRAPAGDRRAYGHRGCLGPRRMQPVPGRRDGRNAEKHVTPRILSEEAQRRDHRYADCMAEKIPVTPDAERARVRVEQKLLRMLRCEGNGEAEPDAGRDNGELFV